jgi:hypothetical protein
MTVCINDSGTWRDASTVCVNDSGTWREIATGCINDSGTWRCFGFFSIGNCSLGDNVEGGYLICKSSGNAIVVAPSSSQVSRNWYSRNDAVTQANAQAACGDWFVPSCSQLKNPGFTCRTYWDSYASRCYWSNSQDDAYNGWLIRFQTGPAIGFGKTRTYCVRAFRTVSY